jgi:hypothetical protein
MSQDDLSLEEIKAIIDQIAPPQTSKSGSGLMKVLQLMASNSAPQYSPGMQPPLQATPTAPATPGNIGASISGQGFHPRYDFLRGKK